MHDLLFRKKGFMQFPKSTISPFLILLQKISLFAILLILFVVSGCTNPPYRGSDVLGAEDFVMDSYRIREGKFSILSMEGKDFEELSPSLLDEYQDGINNGDVLQVAIYHPTRQDLVESVQRIGQVIGFRVADGKIQLPDLPPIHVEGLTLQQAQQQIETLYCQHIKDVSVFISYKDRILRKVELAGLVQLASIPVDGRLRLFEALSMAKVPTNANLFKSYVIRDNLLLPVDLYKLLKVGDMSQNVVMRGGDKVYIADASSSTLMVLGEVGKERVIDLPDGFMTLRKAIAEAGGILPSGDRSYIQIIRGNILHPKIYTLNWEHVVRLPNDSMLLIPGDIVYVAARPLSEWNRFVNDLLPTFIALDLITKGINSVGIEVP
jgi:polysaccharide export outer membrane protein